MWVIAGLGDETTAGGELFRIDPNTNSVVATIDVEMAGPFAVGEGSVWVVTRYAADRTYLTRIDMATNQAAPPVIVQEQWTPFAVGAGRLWLMGGMQPEIRVAGFSLSALELEESIVVGELPAFPGSGIFDPQTSSLWVSQYEGSVTRIDLTST